jgi:hypothetical protein
MTECRCKDLKHIHGRAAQDYIVQHLREIKDNSETWETLYQCPITKTFWKEYYPHSEQHGGGPPELIQITPEDAKRDFKV